MRPSKIYLRARPWLLNSRHLVLCPRRAGASLASPEATRLDLGLSPPQFAERVRRTPHPRSGSLDFLSDAVGVLLSLLRLAPVRLGCRRELWVQLVGATSG